VFSFILIFLKFLKKIFKKIGFVKKTIKKFILTTNTIKKKKSYFIIKLSLIDGILHLFQKTIFFLKSDFTKLNLWGVLLTVNLLLNVHNNFKILIKLNFNKNLPLM
jgi:uncharacterized membrane protein YcgQ (UPF0703/DUF1980 family)